MSHATHLPVQPTGWIRTHRAIALAALFAFLTTAAVVLVLALGGSEPTSSTAGQPTPSSRISGPDESAVAAAVGSQPSVIGPEESNVAAAIGATGEGSTERTGPDESAVASAISGR